MGHCICQELSHPSCKGFLNLVQHVIQWDNLGAGSRHREHGGLHEGVGHGDLVRGQGGEEQGDTLGQWEMAEKRSGEQALAEVVPSSRPSSVWVCSSLELWLIEIDFRLN